MTENAVREALATVFDGCCEDRKISIVDMGLLDGICISGTGVEITLVLTTGWCPFSMRMLTEARERVEEIPGVCHATVKVDWTKAWEPSRLNPGVARQLRLLPTPQNTASMADKKTREVAP